MKTFMDNEGRSWSIDVTVDTVKRVRNRCDVDLLEITEGKLIDRLIRDPVLLCDVVYMACWPEIDQRGVSAESFGRAMAGDAIDGATKALLEALVDFSPNQRDRANLGTVLDKTWKMMDRARDVVQERLESGEIEQAVERALESAGSSSGDAPESSESIPVL